MARQATVERKTKETQIKLTLNLDGSGENTISTGIGFFDHMLTLFSRHSLIDLTIAASGDLEVDYHHTVEDIGICLGKALAEALGDKKGITRFGNASLPMDEVLANVAIDLSGRPYLVFNAEFTDQKVGDYDTALTVEFFQAVATHAGANLHVNVAYGDNAHHINEAIFKAFALALSAGASPRAGVKGIPSTKGSL